uniref:C2H2-type domain-containing protein n=1 Tax=Davidia involucrata TaxID=16924 RepID=A0A5B6ZZM0_DAVIN
MTGQMTTTYRLVRCPRCWLVLPEMADVPLYTCGECGTTLKAKNQKNNTQNSGSCLDGTDPSQKNKLEHVSEDKEAGSLNQQATLPSTGEFASDKNSRRDQNEPGECNWEQPGVIISSDEHSSTELTRCENEETTPEAIVHTEVEEDKCSLDQNNGRDQNEFEDCNGEWPGGIKFSDEVSSSTELNHHENEELSPIARAHIQVDENKYSLEQKDGMDQYESGDCYREVPGKINFSDEVPSSTELSCHEIEEPSPVSGEDENFKSRFIFKTSSADNLLAASPRDSTITSQRPLGESISSDNLTSPYNEQLEQFQKSVLHGLDRVSSVDTLENAPINPSSEICVNHRDLLKSPTTRSNYAYDGSVSSYDGNDDQVQDRHLHLPERNFKVADFVSTKGIRRRDEYMVTDMMSGDLEMQHQARNSLSISSEKQHYAMKSSKWHQDQLLDPTRHRHPVRSRMRLETDEHLSKVPFYSRGSQADHGNGSPSSYRHNEFQCRSSLHSADKPEYPEQEKMELLRMVYELQDQLNRTYISKGKANGRFPAGVSLREKQIPSYYNRVAPDVEMYHDLNYPRHPGRCSQGKSWSQQCKISRIPFSGEATNRRPQVDCSCLHCCPQDWHCSAQLPPRVICCNKGQYTAHPSHKCYNLHHSSSSSPQHYTGSEFSLWSHDMKSDDLWHKDQEVKKYVRERHHTVKRHFRPMAGGAPIIACYHCSELLHLPADFLLFRRRCHRLRCSACSKVLEFSLQNKIHTSPHTPDAIEPPPSEIDDHSDAISRRRLASASHANYCPHAEPVSCSDDYGSSFCRSCSTEGEPYSLMPPLHILERNNYRNMSPASSFEPMKEREKKSVLKQSQNKNKNPVGTFASVGPSSRMSRLEKFSSEIQELRPTTGSPLHRLMGYSSPSEVINGSGLGTSSHFPEEGVRFRN